MEKSFVVVEFPNDKPVTVSVVPRSWLISDKECRWPPSRLRNRDLLLKDPNSKPAENWEISACRILGQFGKYI